MRHQYTCGFFKTILKNVEEVTMSKGINSVELLGNLGKDPEQIHLESGASMVRFSLATHERWKDKVSGELKSHTDWHRVVLVGRQSELAMQYLKKGSLVYVRGKLRTRQYINKNDEQRYVTEVLNRQIIFLDREYSETMDENKEWIKESADFLSE